MDAENKEYNPDNPLQNCDPHVESIGHLMYLTYSQDSRIVCRPSAQIG